MHVVILHQAVSADAPPEERDVLVQAQFVSAALHALGHAVDILPCDLDLAAAAERLRALRPAVVFNLVESLGGSDRLMPLVPALLESLAIPFAGSPAEAICLSTHKLLAKRLMRAAGLPTPDFVAARAAALPDSFHPGARYLIKAVFEHASFGLDDDCLCAWETIEQAHLALAARQAQWRRPCFAEQYIEGREFNVSLLADADGPRLLPLAQIDFSRFPEGKPRIVGYRAKWLEQSAEYHATPRTFTGPCEPPLARQLAELSRACWDLFGLRGWARVDFRVDARGQPWILEVNANPCLAPDAGFAAALTQAGITWPQAVNALLADALRAGNT